MMYSTLILLMIAAAPSASDAEHEALRAVYEVAWLRGQPDFTLEVRGSAPEGVEGALHERLVAEAWCLERPQDLPPDLGVTARPDARYAALLNEAGERVPRLAQKLRPQHQGDADWSDDRLSGLGWSLGLERALTERVIGELERLGVYDILWSSYVEHRDDPDSCQSRFHAFNVAWRTREVPEGEQWKRMITVCGGPPDDIREHVVYRLNEPEVTAERRRAVASFVRQQAVSSCLTAIIASNSALAGRVLALDGLNPASELLETERAVHDAWQRFGVKEAIDEIHRNGAPGPRFEGFVRRCAELETNKGPTETDSSLGTGDTP